MRILYCKVTYMDSYKGMNNDKQKNGGSYIKDKVGHEVYNFADYDGNYYGYVQTKSGKIEINKIDAQNENEEYIDNVLVVWVATKPTGGQYIVGWYNNARVYKYERKTPKEAIESRIYDSRCSHYDKYLINTNNATLIQPNDRSEKIEWPARNIWYGNDKANAQVLRYIKEYEENVDKKIENISDFSIHLEGKEKEALVKIRVNQGQFRNNLLKKFGKCCLCGLANKEVLIASHIKPWRDSDKNDKLNEYNGLLLCPNHDKVFDIGLISFNDAGEILISSRLKIEDRNKLNIVESMCIDVNEANINFIRYHRNHIFKE